MALRTFTSGDGTVWNVWNVVPTLSRQDRVISLGAGMTEGWLCFESTGAKRRVVPTPTGWEEWSEAELETALSTAQEVRRPRERAEGEAGAEATGG